MMSSPPPTTPGPPGHSQGSSGFQNVVNARQRTASAIAEYALARHALEQIRGDREASSEDIFELAQETRQLEASVSEAISKECAAVVAAEEEA